MSAPTVRIVAVGAITSIGIGAAQTDASLRAGLCRFREGPWPQGDDAVVMARVRDEALIDPLARLAAAPALRLDDWSRRVIAIAGLAIADATMASQDPRPIALQLGVADPREGMPTLAPPALWAALSIAAERPIDAGRSRLFARGRAAIFDAIAAGRDLLRMQPDARVVCGGVDSYVDAERVRREHALGRTQGGPWAGDGRALGEAAGMLVLEADPQQRGGVVLAAIGRAEDPGHRFGHAPARGEGLADAIEALRGELEPGVPFGVAWAGLTGESHDVKLWGTACLRHRDLLVAQTRVEHPADRIGDAGAGLGAVMFVDAHQRLITGRCDGPALLWAASDHGPCGSAMLSAAERPVTDTGDPP